MSLRHNSICSLDLRKFGNSTPENPLTPVIMVVKEAGHGLFFLQCVDTSLVRYVCVEGHDDGEETEGERSNEERMERFGSRFIRTLFRSINNCENIKDPVFENGVFKRVKYDRDFLHFEKLENNTVEESKQLSKILAGFVSCEREFFGSRVSNLEEEVKRLRKKAVRVLVIGKVQGKKNSIERILRNHSELFRVSYLVHSVGSRLEIPRRHVIELFDLVVFDFKDAYFNNNNFCLHMQPAVKEFIEAGIGVFFTHDTLDYCSGVSTEIKDYAGIKIVSRTQYPNVNKIEKVNNHALFNNFYELEGELTGNPRITQTHSTYITLDETCTCDLLLREVNRGNGIYLTVKDNGEEKGRVVYTAAGHTKDELTGFEKKLMVNIALWTSKSEKYV